MNVQTASETSADDLRALDTAVLHGRIAQFLYREARLADSHDYDGWEALWEDDGLYWVPANGLDTDPETQMSILYDNRSRIHVRIEQLKTGRRHTQTPRSELARLISNIEIGEVADTEVTAFANSMIYEDNLRGETVWATRNEYRLRLVGGAFRLVFKKIALVNNGKPIFTLSFLV
ncbi:MAG: ring-hydroxylating dioxygenase subunit beta [Sphingobium sp.]|nr:MAG: ring-hydroxylating dioxygenase subunit beta [Sphingobium sp.]